MDWLGRLRRRMCSFHRRRIAIPVGADALVLDVGSGDKPHWRADVLVDLYAGVEHAGQRSGRDAARVSRPLFDADAADMPFADKVFDYAVCSHVLEHVPDPAAVVAEISRVARAGYIEVPDAASAKILDFPSHVWWCRLDGGTLVFTAKSARAFDPEIAAYIEVSGLEQQLAKLLDSEFDHRVISLPWRDTVSIRVEGTPNPAFLADALTAESRHRSREALAARALTAAMTLPWGLRRPAIRYDDIVRPEHRRGDGELLRRQIYRVA